MRLTQALLSTLVCASTLMCTGLVSAAPAATYGGTHGSDLVPYWGPGAGNDNIGYTFNGSTGFFFVPSEDIEVTALGVMDFGAPGLEASHSIEIYENVNPNVVPCVGCTMPREVTGDLVVASTIGDGTSGDFTSGWGRYVELASSVVLEAGVEYYIVTDNLGCDPVATQWFGYCGDADNSDQDMSVFGAAAVSFDSRIAWTGYANAYDVATGESWDLDESYQIPPGLGVNGNIGPVFWIEDDVCTYGAHDWAALQTWPAASLTYAGTVYDRARTVSFLGLPSMSPFVRLWQELVVTDLNLANGANDSEVRTTRTQAADMVDRWLAGQVRGAAAEAAATALRLILADYNSGVIGPGACDPVACE